MSDIPSFLSRAGAYMTLIPIQPSPMAETSRLLFPSLRFFMMSFGCNSYGVGTTHIADASVAQAPFDARLLRFSSNGRIATISVAQPQSSRQLCRGGVLAC